jgi:hypothetical protein
MHPTKLGAAPTNRLRAEGKQVKELLVQNGYPRVDEIMICWVTCTAARSIRPLG